MHKSKNFPSLIFFKFKIVERPPTDCFKHYGGSPESADLKSIGLHKLFQENLNFNETLKKTNLFSTIKNFEKLDFTVDFTVDFNKVSALIVNESEVRTPVKHLEKNARNLNSPNGLAV